MQEKREHQMEQAEAASLEPITILRDILRRWYVVLAAALLIGMAAYVVTEQRYTPVYQTNTTLVVSARGSSTTVYQNLSAASNLATVFSEVLNSSLLRKEILNQLGMTAFDGTISASVIEETNLLTMRVTASDPRTAFLVTQEVIKNHGIVSYQVLGDTVLEVLQKPVVPTAPSNPLYLGAVMKKAALLAGVVMCALLGMLSYLRSTIRTKHEAKRKLNCRFMGEIRHERKYKTLLAMLKRKKTSILVSNPTTSFQFTETFRKLRRQVEQHMPMRRPCPDGHQRGGKRGQVHRGGESGIDPGPEAQAGPAHRRRPAEARLP